MSNKVWINFSTDPQWKAVTPLGNTVLAQLSKECLNLIQQLVLQFTLRKHQLLSRILLFLDFISSPCMENLLVCATNSREAAWFASYWTYESTGDKQIKPTFPSPTNIHSSISQSKRSTDPWAFPRETIPASWDEQDFPCWELYLYNASIDC